MTDYRTEALEEIKSRFVRDRELLGLKTFNWNSNSPINKLSVPSVYMFEGRDVIEKYNQGNILGYPARRHLEINIEIVTKNNENASDVKELLKLVRRTVFCEKDDSGEDTIWTINAVVAKNAFIRELRIKGPGLYDVPELVGIKLVIGLWYTDEGIF